MNYLIVAPAWIGDAVMAQSLYIQLRQNNSSCAIDVIAPEWSQPLLKRMPEIRQSMTLSAAHGETALALRFKTARMLRPQNYQQAIVLPNSFKSALLPFWARIPRRTGWRGEMRYGLLNDLRKLDKKRFPLMVERFVALSYEKKSVPQKIDCPRPYLKVDIENLSLAKNRLNLKDNSPILALCPGAEFGPAKQWPAEYYAELAREKCTQGFQLWLFGSQKDRSITSQIASLLPVALQEKIFNLAGQTTLGDAIDLLSEAELVVSNDSGLMHIAAALHRPLAVIYGSTSPEFTPPLSDNHVSIRSNLNCSPCFKRICPLGHGNCLKQIKPQKIIEALQQVTPDTPVSAKKGYQ